MPTTDSAKKRVRQNEKARRRNKKLKTSIKLARRALEEAIEAEESSEEIEQLKQKAEGCVDRAVNKNVLHRNRAARIKSQLDNMVNQS